jgi:hypothetical protein
MLVSVSQSHVQDYLIERMDPFSYMLEGVILDRVDSITKLEVVMDSRMSFSKHVDVTVGKALAMMGFVKRLSGEFRDQYTLRTLYVSLVRSLSNQFVYGGLFKSWIVNRIERVQRKFIRYAFRGLDWIGWTCMIFLHTWTDVL